MTQQTDLRALILPPMAWQPERDAFVPGAEPDVFEIYRRLAAAGIATRLIDPGRRPLNPLAGRGTVLESLDPLRALRVLAGERRADIVVCVFEGPAVPLVLLRRLARFKVPVVLWDLGLTESWTLRERLLDRAVPAADAIFVLSGSQRDYIGRRWGRAAGVEIVGHHVDTAFFHPAAAAPGGPILAVGEDAGRDFEALIDVAPAIGTDIVLKTRRIKPDRVLPPRVGVLRDRLSYGALRDLYASCRFMVVPLIETLNASGVSTILEAGAMGLGLVVSDSSAIRDFVVPGETCLLVPCGDRAALEAAIRRLPADPAEAARLGANGRRFIEAKFSKPAFADRLAGLLRRYARPSRP